MNLSKCNLKSSIVRVSISPEKEAINNQYQYRIQEIISKKIKKLICF